MAAKEISPLTGILAEDIVYVDFGEHEGKSVLEVSDTHPEFYEFMIGQKNSGNFFIKRAKDKSFRLYLGPSAQNWPN